MLDETLQRAALATSVLSESRMKARSTSIQAIRALESKIVEALAGDKLRGMPNLVPKGEALHAMRVNSWSRHGAAGWLPRDGREVLVFTSEGRLTVAKLVGEGAALRGVEDEELVLEDLEPFIRIAQEALEKHAALADKRVQSFARIERLATKLVDALGLEIRLSAK